MRREKHLHFQIIRPSRSSTRSQKWRKKWRRYFRKSFKTWEKVQEQISTMFLPPYTWYKFCDIDSKLPNTENCWIGGRDSWLWFPREAVGDGQVFAHTGQHSVHVTDLESAHNCKQGWAETIELFSEYAQHSEASSNCAHVAVVYI